MKKLEKNMPLYTKDGRVFGNAIINTIQGDLVTLTTDYGNVINLLYHEIYDLFYTDNGLSDEEYEYVKGTHKNRSRS